MEEIYEEALSTYEDKNDDYGDSWKKVGAIKAVMNSNEIESYELEGKVIIELDTVSKQKSSYEDEVVDGMLTRMIDKIVRINQLQFFTENKVDEQKDDSAGDLGNYAFMLKKFLLNNDSYTGK